MCAMSGTFLDEFYIYVYDIGVMFLFETKKQNINHQMKE